MIAETEIVLKRYFCSWCKLWFIRHADGRTMYVEAPIEAGPATHGICVSCRTAVYRAYTRAQIRDEIEREEKEGVKT